MNDGKRSHIQLGDWLDGAGSGRYRAIVKANRLSPEIYHRVGGRYCSLRSRQYSCNRYGRGYKNPTGSLEDGEILQGADMNSGEPMYSLRECPIKPMDGKMRQDIIHWQSDYSIVSKKSVKADGEKGIAVMQRRQGTHLPDSELGMR